MTPIAYAQRFPGLHQPLTEEDLWHALHDAQGRWMCLGCGAPIEPGDDIFADCCHMLARNHPLYRGLRADVQRGLARGATLRAHMEEDLCSWEFQVHCACEARVLAPRRPRTC